MGSMKDGLLDVIRNKGQPMIGYYVEQYKLSHA